MSEIEALWHSHIEIWDEHFMSESSLFFVLAGQIAEIFLCCSLVILLCNGQNIAD